MFNQTEASNFGQLHALLRDQATLDSGGPLDDVELESFSIIAGLLDRLLIDLEQADTVIRDTRHAANNPHLEHACDILEVLISAVDIEKGGDTAVRLFAFYDEVLEQIERIMGNDEVDDIAQVHLCIFRFFRHFQAVNAKSLA